MIVANCELKMLREWLTYIGESQSNKSNAEIITRNAAVNSPSSLLHGHSQQTESSSYDDALETLISIFLS